MLYFHASAPHFALNAADGTDLCALAAAYASFRLHSGVAAAAHLDGPQWTGIFPTRRRRRTASYLWRPVSLTA